MMTAMLSRQRKRVTSGEMLVANAPVMFADEISTGLDSASTKDICNTLRIFSKTMQMTIMVSLLQPPPEV